MKALSVRSNNDLLYTVVHHPAEKNEILPGHAVVICSPITNEHDICYWAMRQLAVRLSRIGYHVVRFDYFATGNSAGESQQLSLECCVKNITDIARYIRVNTKCEKLAYIGLRLGAVLASMSARELTPDGLILWDPVISGRRYMQELVELQEKLLKNMKCSASHRHNLGNEYMGYPYPDNLIGEINQLQQEEIEIPANTALSILTSPNNPDQDRYLERLRECDVKFQHEVTTQWPLNSQGAGAFDSTFLPGRSINQICDFLRAEK